MEELFSLLYPGDDINNHDPSEIGDLLGRACVGMLAVVYNKLTTEQLFLLNTAASITLGISLEELIRFASEPTLSLQSIKNLMDKIEPDTIYIDVENGYGWESKTFNDFFDNCEILETEETIIRVIELVIYNMKIVPMKIKIEIAKEHGDTLIDNIKKYLNAQLADDYIEYIENLILMPSQIQPLTPMKPFAPISVPPLSPQLSPSYFMSAKKSVLRPTRHGPRRTSAKKINIMNTFDVYKSYDNDNNITNPTSYKLLSSRNVIRTSPKKLYKTGNSTQYKNSMNRNRFCGDNDFIECFDLGGHKMSGKYTIIGKGMYGALIKTEMANGQSVVVKFTFSEGNEKSNENFKNNEKELFYTYLMGEYDIGPKVFDSFYYNIDRDDFDKYPFLKQIITDIITKYPNFAPSEHMTMYTRAPYEIQCVVMEAFDTDCQTALDDTTLDIDTRVQIIRQMIALIQKQISLGLYCFDSKPGNFVVNITQHTIDVRMIDFGADFCTQGTIFYPYKNQDDFFLPGLTWIDFSFISNVIQMYILCWRMDGFDGLDDDDARKLYNAYLDSPLIKLFLSYPQAKIKKFFIWYYTWAIDKRNLGFIDTSTNFMHYASFYDTSTVKDIEENVGKIMRRLFPSFI